MPGQSLLGSRGSGVAEGRLETFGLIAIAALLGLAAAFLGGAHLAARLAGHPAPFDAGLPDSATALWRLPSTLANPAAAWGPERRHALPGATTYYLSLAAVVGAALVVALLVARAWGAVTKQRQPLGVEPNAGLASGGDLRQLQVRRPKNGRLILGRVGGRLVATETQVSLAVVGPTGCGKSAGFAIPALLEWEGPVIATSVKTDLVEATIARRHQLGQVWLFDPAGCTGFGSSQWSPLDGCGDWSVAMRVTSWLCDAADAKRDTVTDGDYWYTQALKVLAPHLHAAALGGHTMRDVVRWIDGQDQEPVRSVLRAHAGVGDEIERALNDEVAKDHRSKIEPRTRAEVLESTRQVLRADPSARSELADEKVTNWPVQMQEQFEERVAIEVDRKLAQILESRVMEAARGRGDLDALIAAESLWAKEERLRGSVYATVQNVLLSYANPEVAAVTDSSEVDLDEWLDGPNTIYVVATADEQARFRPVLTVLIQRAIRRAYEVANADGGTLTLPCLVLLDEAGNIVPLKDLPGYASTARSHGITLVSVWQDLGQIRAIYGQRAPTVLNNHRAKIFAAGIDCPETLDYVSRLVGDEARTERNFSADLAGGPRRSVSEHTAYRRLLPMDVIRRIAPNEALLLYGSRRPAHLHLRPWYQDRSLKALAGPLATDREL
ncbi:MAG: type IV secretory system conjugative DNA transfer family protein [Actinomycetota bacterium]|nr:type IV secretory system conjugative DNA transfer family protein [Actinomycetota bacterium]